MFILNEFKSIKAVLNFLKENGFIASITDFLPTKELDDEDDMPCFEITAYPSIAIAVEGLLEKVLPLFREMERSGVNGDKPLRVDVEQGIEMVSVPCVQSDWLRKGIQVNIFFYCSKSTGEIFELPFLYNQIRKKKLVHISQLDTKDILTDNFSTFKLLRGRFHYRKKDYIVVPSKRKKYQIVEAYPIDDERGHLYFYYEADYIVRKGRIDQ